ncbi:MAG: hypothetical protein U0104_14485 [Gemmatimonadales bacterium]
MPARSPHPAPRRALPTLLFLLLVGAPLAAQQPWPGRDRLEAERCTPASGDGGAWLARAGEATGLATLRAALRFTATESDAQFFQSDRMVPPFIGSATAYEFTFEPVSGAEQAVTLVPGGGRGRALIRTPRALFGVRDTTLVPAPAAFRLFELSRPLNPLAILAEWRGAPASVVAHCGFRDYPRVVLSRGVAGERLYLNARSGAPVKYERIEPHPLWGQVRAEYVYATWWQAGPVMLPVVAVRYLDGVEQLRRDLRLPQTPAETLADTVPAATALARPLPAPLPDHTSAPDPSQRVVPVDTVRVDAQTFLLRTPMYTHAVTRVRDTVYLFDATTAEWRSRADSAWIATLFPGARATVLVVTDLAWPHVSGIRFWAARGATIATHRLSVPFLRRIIERRWTLAPDALEQRPGAAARIRWIPVDSAATLAGGAVRLHVIDGVSSEGALLALLDGPGLLWAGDYIQSADEPSVYAREVIAAAGRAGFRPTRAAAQHLPLTPWTDVTRANPSP